MTDWSWRRDTAAPDYWIAIRDHLEDSLREAQRMVRWSPELIALIERRYREGCKEHKGDWLTRPLNWFDTMMAEELADLIVYGAMRRVRAEQIPSSRKA